MVLEGGEGRGTACHFDYISKRGNLVSRSHMLVLLVQIHLQI